jgi:polyferredoxin
MQVTTDEMNPANQGFAETYDRTARKFHQAVCVLILALGFVLGSAIGLWLVGFVGLILLVGRYWWPADVFRQLAWRVLEPAGLLHRQDVQEDHHTRRVARVLGGSILLIAAILLSLGQSWAWLPVGAIGLMIALDATFDFCALCAVTYRVGRLTAR